MMFGFMAGFSEHEFQRQLQAARVAGRDDLSQPGIEFAAGGIKARGGIEAVELDVVENVVGFAPELETVALFDGDVLVKTGVPVVDAGSAEAVFAGVAERANRGRAKPAGLKKAY